MSILPSCSFNMIPNFIHATPCFTYSLSKSCVTQIKKYASDIVFKKAFTTQINRYRIDNKINFTMSNSKNQILVPAVQNRHYSNNSHYNKSNGSNKNNDHIPFGTLFGAFIVYQTLPFMFHVVDRGLDIYKNERSLKHTLALEKAINEKDVAGVKKWLEKGADVDWSCSIPNQIDNKIHRSLFTQACKKGNIEIIELMLEKKPLLSTADEGCYQHSESGNIYEEYTTIIEFLSQNHYRYENVSEVIRVLVRHGAEPGLHCLSYTLEKNDFELYKICIVASEKDVKNGLFGPLCERKQEFDNRMIGQHK